MTTIPNELIEYVEDIYKQVSDYCLDGSFTILIMRGLPGSGKSTVSKEVQRMVQLNFGAQVVRISTDEILEMCEAGYKWAGYKMRLYHGIAERIAEGSFINRVPLIMLDNTNMKKKDYEWYVRMAEFHGYKVLVETVGEFTPDAIELSFHRTTHSVPYEAIERMAKRFQP